MSYKPSFADFLNHLTESHVEAKSVMAVTDVIVAQYTRRLSAATR